MHDDKENSVSFLPARGTGTASTPFSPSKINAQPFVPSALPVKELSASKPRARLSGIYNDPVASPHIGRSSLLPDSAENEDSNGNFDGFSSKRRSMGGRSSLGGTMMPMASPLSFSRSGIGGLQAGLRSAQKPAAPTFEEDTVMEEIDDEEIWERSIPLLVENLKYLASWQSPADSASTATALGLFVGLAMIFSPVSVIASVLLLTIAVQANGNSIMQKIAVPGSAAEDMLNLKLFDMASWHHGMMIVQGSIVEQTHFCFDAIEKARTGDDVTHTAKTLLGLVSIAGAAPLVLAAPLKTLALAGVALYSAYPAMARMQPHFNKAFDAVQSLSNSAQLAVYSAGVTALLAIAFRVVCMSLSLLRLVGVAISCGILLAKASRAQKISPARVLMNLAVELGQAGAGQGMTAIRALQAFTAEKRKTM